mmetsp:Transcript_47159/g.85137  ORF Transcript_47159/g.85137 Transcript_47159/m.85137 type:complete len:724 (+) Transcript_47159:86-2257(+)
MKISGLLPLQLPILLPLLPRELLSDNSDSCPFEVTGSVLGLDDSLRYLGKLELDGRANLHGSVEVEASIVQAKREIPDILNGLADALGDAFRRRLFDDGGSGLTSDSTREAKKMNKAKAAPLLATDIIKLERDGTVLTWGGGLQTSSSRPDQQWYLRKCVETDLASCLGQDASWTDTIGTVSSGDVVSWVSVPHRMCYDCSDGTCSQESYPPPSGRWGTLFRIIKVGFDGREAVDGTAITNGDTVYFYGMQSMQWDPAHIINCDSVSCSGSSANTVHGSKFVIVQGTDRELRSDSYLRDVCTIIDSKPAVINGWLHLVAFQDSPEVWEKGWTTTGNLPRSLFHCDTNRSSVKDSERVFPGDGVIKAHLGADRESFETPGQVRSVWQLKPETDEQAETAFLVDKPISKTQEYLHEHGDGEEVPGEAVIEKVGFDSWRSLWVTPPHNRTSTWHLALVKCADPDVVSALRDAKDMLCQWAFNFKVRTNCLVKNKPIPPPPQVPILDERLKVSGPLQSGGLCLTFDSSEMTAHMQPCNGGNEQIWFFHQHALHNQAAPTLCLDWTRQRDVYLLKCNEWGVDGSGWRSQQDWYFDGAALTTKKSASWCLDYTTNNYHAAYMSDCRHGEAKQWTHKSRRKPVKKPVLRTVISQKEEDSPHRGILTSGILTALGIMACLLVWWQCCAKTRRFPGLQPEANEEVPMRTIGIGGSVAKPMALPQQVYSMLAD